MTTYYIDPVAGSNANAGTDIAAPKRDFTSFSGAFVGGNSYLVKAGTTMTTSSGTRANVETSGTSATNRVYIGRYGEGANPILNGNNSYYPIYIKAGANITVEDIDVTNAAASGIRIESKASATIDDVIIRRCRAYRNCTLQAVGVDGITVVKGLNGGALTNILMEGCDSFENRGHGIKGRDGVNGMIVRSCRAWNNGTGAGSHGMGTSSSAVAITSGWTLISGTIYEATVSTAALLTSTVTEWAAVIVNLIGGYKHLVKSATPATPGLGEYGIGANNTVRINVGTSPNGSTTRVSSDIAQNVRFEDCMAWGTTDYDGNEGSGFQFDNASKDCQFIRCTSFDNQGAGFLWNECAGCDVRDSLAYNNDKGGAYLALSTGAEATGNTLIGVDGVYNVTAVTGAELTLTNNVLVGGSVGIYSSSATVAPVTEDYNCIHDCATARTNVTAGASSIAVDPLLSSSYRLLPGSPLIGAGTYLGPSRDINGVKRGRLPTIGAREPATLRLIGA